MSEVSFGYNGLCDRLAYELTNGIFTSRADYTLDLINDLAQVLASSGTGDPSGYTYLYGLGRIAQETPTIRE